MLLLLAFLSLAASKFVSTSVTLNKEDSWKYLTKFAAIEGVSTYEIRAKLAKPMNSESKGVIMFKTGTYIDKRWQQALDSEGCDQKQSESQRQQVIMIPEDGEWSDAVLGKIVSNRRTHFWYFSLSKCDLEERMRVKVEIKLINSDGSELSAEEYYLEYIFLSLFVVFFVALSSNLYKLVKKFNKSEDLETNLLVLNISIACTFIGILFEMIHIWVYIYNGSGVVVFDVFYQILEVLSSILISILLIVIASGWTLKYKDFPDADIYIPISLFVVIFNLMIVTLGRITEDTYYKNSDYESLPGYCLVLMRVLLWLWFIYLVKDLHQSASLKLQGFLFRFSILSSAYFLALPIVLVFSWVFVPYVRNQVVTVLINLIQIIVFWSLSHLFSEKSTFYKISTMSESVLPGKYN